MPGYPRPRSVRPVPLADLAAVADAAPLVLPAEVTVTGITHSSQAVRPGDLYAALPGARTHGAAFAAAAVAAGAVAILTDPAGLTQAEASGVPTLCVPDPRKVLGHVASRVYGVPTEHLTVIGITGTAGKTSTVHLVDAGLRAAGKVTGLIGTVGTRLGDLAIEGERTTPEAPDLQALFAAAVEQGVEAVTMEVSSHALQLERVGGVHFAVGGFTNLGLDHLDFHADVQEYFEAKARLFDGRSDIAIVNGDDPKGRLLVRPGTQTFSLDKDSDATWRAVDLAPLPYGQSFTVLGPDGVSVAAEVSPPGRHNVANALLAIAVLVAVGVSADVAAKAVAEAGGAPGRMERVRAPGPVIGVVDYAHKPDAIVEVLAALREFAGSHRVICVIGAGGDRDRQKRPLMGAAAARGADIVLVTDDNPRTEDPARIRAEVMAGVTATPGTNVIEIVHRDAAIAEAVAMAEAGDVVALLGKGHETGQEINGVMHPFDDRVELAKALAARFGER